MLKSFGVLYCLTHCLLVLKRFKILFIIMMFMLCMLCVCEWRYTDVCRGQRKTFGSWFFPLWVLGVTLRLQVLDIEYFLVMSHQSHQHCWFFFFWLKWFVHCWRQGQWSTQVVLESSSVLRPRNICLLSLGASVLGVYTFAIATSFCWVNRVLVPCWPSLFPFAVFKF